MPKSKMPEKEFYTIEEVATLLDLGDRTSVYPYIKRLDIKKHKFDLDRHRYISAQDFDRIKRFKAEPWKKDEILKRTGN